MKRPGEKRRPPGGNAERRRRQFEESRGLSERPVLPLDEEGTGDPDLAEPPPEDEQPPRDENEQHGERDAR